MTALHPSVLGSRARRGRVAAPKEQVLHVAVAKLLREHVLPEWQWFHVPSGEHRDIRTAAKLKAMGTRRGIPDFILISPTGSVRCVELKRLGKGLTEDQAAFKAWCIKNDIPHAVAWTIDDALAALDHWGCLNIRLGCSS